jgi:hypothetical protein
MSQDWRTVWRKPSLTRSTKIDGLARRTTFSILPALGTAALPVWIESHSAIVSGWRTKPAPESETDHNRPRADARRREIRTIGRFRTASLRERSSWKPVKRAEGRHAPASAVVATLCPRLGDTRNESDIFLSVTISRPSLVPALSRRLRQVSAVNTRVQNRLDGAERRFILRLDRQSKISIRSSVQALVVQKCFAATGLALASSDFCRLPRSLSSAGWSASS